MSEPVLMAVHGPVAQLTLNRPESYNALNIATTQALTRALLDLGADLALIRARASRMSGVTGAAWIVRHNGGARSRSSSFRLRINGAALDTAQQRRQRPTMTFHHRLAALAGDLAERGIGQQPVHGSG